MTAEQDIVFPEPVLNEAYWYSQRLWVAYGLANLGGKEQVKEFDEIDAAKRLEDLAVGIIRGEVTSHLEIARVIQSTGQIGPLGGFRMQIDLASFKLVYAIKGKLDNLGDVEVLMENPYIGLLA